MGHRWDMCGQSGLMSVMSVVWPRSAFWARLSFVIVSADVIAGVATGVRGASPGRDPETSDQSRRLSRRPAPSKLSDDTPVVDWRQSVRTSASRMPEREPIDRICCIHVCTVQVMCTQCIPTVSDPAWLVAHTSLTSTLTPHGCDRLAAKYCRSNCECGVGDCGRCCISHLCHTRLHLE